MSIEAILNMDLGCNAHLSSAKYAMLYGLAIGTRKDPFAAVALRLLADREELGRYSGKSAECDQPAPCFHGIAMNG
jgi:hypothetical protein